MPNYVRNILQINATPEKIEEVFNAIQSDTDPEQLFDFNKIIPMLNHLKWKQDPRRILFHCIVKFFYH